MEDIKAIKAHLERMSQEISDLMKILMKVDIRDRERREEAWRSLLDASEEVTRLWKGPSAAEEIRSQREKTW
jgi:hypothetical protein